MFFQSNFKLTKELQKLQKELPHTQIPQMLTSCRAARNDQEIDNDEKYSDEEIDIDMHVVI